MAEAAAAATDTAAGSAGSPTQEFCGGPPSTDGDEGVAWNLDDDEEQGREGPTQSIQFIPPGAGMNAAHYRHAGVS